MAKDRQTARTKTVNAPYVPSRVVRDGALMSGLLPSVRIEGPVYHLIPEESGKELGKEITEDIDEGWFIDKHTTKIKNS